MEHAVYSWPFPNLLFSQEHSFRSLHLPGLETRAHPGGCIKVRASARRSVVKLSTFFLALGWPHARRAGVGHAFKGVFIASVIALPVKGWQFVGIVKFLGGLV